MNRDPMHKAKNAANLLSDSLFYSERTENEWLLYDFGGMMVSVTHSSVPSVLRAEDLGTPSVRQ
jgi:hypothetical protein